MKNLNSGYEEFQNLASGIESIATVLAPVTGPVDDLSCNARTTHSLSFRTKAKYSYIARVPKTVSFLNLHSRFNYIDGKTPHMAEATVCVPRSNGEIEVSPAAGKEEAKLPDAPPAPEP